MNINKLQNYNQNFNGYKNILAGSIKGAEKNTLSFMAMHLDGKDLEVWKTIQKSLLKIKEPSNVITFDVFQLREYQDMSIGDHNLDLNMIEPGTEKENLTMKALTLIASLTKRIASENNPVFDCRLNETGQKSYNRIKILFDGNSHLILPFLERISPKRSQPQVEAKRINEFVTDYMKNYF